MNRIEKRRGVEEGKKTTLVEAALTSLLLRHNVIIITPPLPILTHAGLGSYSSTITKNSI